MIDLLVQRQRTRLLIQLLDQQQERMQVLTSTRAELLDGLLNPSAIIEPKFASYAVQLADGRSLTGVLTKRDATGIELRDAKGDAHKLASSDIEEIKPLRASLMPEGLLKDLTLQEAADLLAFLETLK